MAPLIFTVLIILVAILLIGVVLIQNSKGGGLASNVGLSTQMMGVKKTADAVEKWTWYLIAGMVVLCLASSFVFRAPKQSNPYDVEISQPTPSSVNQVPNSNLGGTTNGGTTPQP